MDLIQILRNRIDSLEDGPYTPGLRAVLQHVQVAANHLKRGGDTLDDTAFTDAIYRTNQAFEGSLKEAFRVLAAKDPEKVRPFDIEAFFQDQSVLRSRVLEQMSRYRTAWRDPSTHDYKLDIDQDEALLAIVSVCAFAIALIDQITERVNFDRAKAAAKPQSSPANTPLAEMTADALLTFQLQSTKGESGGHTRETELIGALAGHLEAVLPGTKITTDARIGEDRPQRADILIEGKGERVLLEVKRTRFAHNIRAVSVSQVSHYVALSGIREAILYLFTDAEGVEMEREDYPLPGAQARIIVIGPKRVNRSA